MATIASRLFTDPEWRAPMPRHAPRYHMTTISKSSAIARRHPAALMCFADDPRIAPEQPEYNYGAKVFHNFDEIVDKWARNGRARHCGKAGASPATTLTKRRQA
jgi:hypothetical protein